MFKCGRYLSSEQALALAPLTVASLVAFVMKPLTPSADRACQSAFPVTTHAFSLFSDSPLIPILRQWKPTFRGLVAPLPIADGISLLQGILSRMDSVRQNSHSSYFSKMSGNID